MSLATFLYENIYAPLIYLMWAALLLFTVSVVIFHFREKSRRSLMLLIATALTMVNLLFGQALLYIFNNMDMEEDRFSSFIVVSRVHGALEGYFALLTILALCACLAWPARRL